MESFMGGSSSSRPIHVYLSFKGDDETCGFTDRLWAALESDDLNTSWDDKKLHPADSIFLPRHLLKATRQSNISIVVFSKSYASSIWCLEELCAIAERIHEPRYTVFPIFYDVDPSEVQKQSNSFQKAFAENEPRFSANSREVHRWRLVMKQVANLSGWHVSCNPCPEVIDDIVREVKKKVRELVYVDADLVGMQSRVREVKELLDLGSSDDEVRVVGICGMGGIGKSTLARVLYDKISHHFDASYFLSDVSQFDYTIFLTRLTNSFVVMDIINCSYLKEMAWMVKSNWLGDGSRIILITRDEGVLKWFGKHHIYRVKLLTKDEALQLFCRNAFRCDYPIRGYDKELINRALDYANGLPLAIVKLGSFLYNRRASEWSTALVEFKRFESVMIMKVLKTSFDELDLIPQSSFLDIACFFAGKEIKHVEGVLNDIYLLYCMDLFTCNNSSESRNYFEPYNAKNEIQVLVERSLVTIIDQKIQMHGLLQKMGRGIIRHDFPSKPEEWSRLWDFDDIYRVMQNDTATDLKVRAIVLELEEDSQGSALRVEALSRMRKLRLLIFHNVKFFGVLTRLSSRLRYISWHRYPFTSLPSTFVPWVLKELILPHSCITSIWDEEELPDSTITTASGGTITTVWEIQKTFGFLRNMNLSWSKDLIKMPNFKVFPHLERLELEGCTRLSHLDPSITHLSKLKFLNLRNCSNLVSIPNALFSLPSLEMLNMAGCSKFACCLNFCPSEELAERERIQQSFPCKRQRLCRHKSV